MELCVIIVSLNVKPYLDHCLRSLFEALKGIDAAVWVVDNASSDDTITWLPKAYPQVHLLALGENLGFSKANNLPLSKTDASFTLFLNPDTIMEDQCLHQCLSLMKAHPEAGGLGLRMINGKGAFLRESKRGIPTPSAAFFKMSGLADLFPRNRIMATYHAGHLDDHSTQAVPILSGAFLLVRREVLKTTGSFDERFFLYGEDIDLSYRILKDGWTNIFFADSTLIHFKGQSTNKKSSNYRTHFFGAMTLFVQKYYQGPLALVYRGLLQTGILFQKVRFKLFPPAQTVTPDNKYTRWLLWGSERDTQDFVTKYDTTGINLERVAGLPASPGPDASIVFCLGERRYTEAIRQMNQPFWKSPAFFYHRESDFLIGPDKNWPIPFRKKQVAGTDQEPRNSIFV
jgi:GT2 family glycosyltransferase